jgi:quercetin dioxygenase-like cupin family protein
MSEKKYDKFIITNLSTKVNLPPFRHDAVIAQPQPTAYGKKQHVLWVDGEAIPGGFYSEYMWHFPGQIAAESPAASPDSHVHAFDEVIGFIGINQNDHTDLGGEVEVTLEDQTFDLTKSFLVYIPAGMRHCPVTVKQAKSPIFQYVLGSVPRYEGNTDHGASAVDRSTLAKQFVFDYKKNLVHPEYRGAPNEVPGIHLHILYVDKEVVPGARFYVEASWFGTKTPPKPEPGKEPKGPQPHTHPFPEIITFFGTNPDDIHDLGGEVELWIEGEQYIMSRSFVAYVPGNVIHCPIMIRNVKRPIFHFTAGPGDMYV